ncbi:hypothetical protein [Natrinema sp. DC36]|uniref:hypothetical protein n=1 Tax=Natrinema sp. DC36 TaxID=2878680 RepID=UPI001CF0760F|nr:hypothetical protein [Natrinema sp. DC36]
MTRPDDVLFRARVETFALVRKLLPIALLAGAMVGPLYRFEPTVAMWISAVSFLVILVGLLLVSRLPLYPAHTFGIEYRFEEEPFDTGRRQCVRCSVLAESGTHRRYARQIVVLGVPLHTLEWGSNDFCGDCVALGDAVDSRPMDERTAVPDPTPTQSTAREPDRSRDVKQERERERATGSPSGGEMRSDGEPPRLERARRIDRSDETTALELRRAFD